MIKPTRPALVKAEGIDALDGTAGAIEFVFATSQGRAFHIDDEGNVSDTSRPGSRDVWVGVRVVANKRRELADHRGFKQKTWNEKWIPLWTAAGMAHRCGRGGPDALFLEPVSDVCLSCKKPLIKTPRTGGEIPTECGELTPRCVGDFAFKSEIHRAGTSRSENKEEMPGSTPPPGEGDPFHRMRQAARQERWGEAASIAASLGEDRLEGFAKNAAARLFFDLLSIRESQARAA